MNLFNVKSFLYKFTSSLLVFLHLSVFVVPANAGTTNISGYGGDSFVKGLIAGNAVITKNDAGATILNLPAGETTERTYDLFHEQPMVWGKWYRLAGAGTIQVVKAIRTPNVNSAGGHVQLQVFNFDPDMASKLYANGNGIKNYYGGVDPFAVFKPATGIGGVWSKISRNEFFTAVGQAAMHFSTTRGYVAVALQDDKMRTWDQCLVKIPFGGCLYQRHHQELTSFVKPVWSVITTPDTSRAGSYIAAFKVSGCTLSDASCVVNSGVAFKDASSNSDFPSERTLLNTIEHHQDGLTGLAFALLFATFAVVAGPLVLDGPGLFASAINSAVGATAITTTAGAFAAEAIGYSIVTMATSTGGSLNNIQNGFFGNLNGAFDNQITAPGVEPTGLPRPNNLASFPGGLPNIPVAGNYTPPVVDSEWDMRPAIISKFITPDIKDTPTGVSELYNGKPVSTADTPSNDFWQQRETPPIKFGGEPGYE